MSISVAIGVGITALREGKAAPVTPTLTDNEWSLTPVVVSAAQAPNGRETFTAIVGFDAATPELVAWTNQNSFGSAPDGNNVEPCVFITGVGWVIWHRNPTEAPPSWFVSWSTAGATRSNIGVFSKDAGIGWSGVSTTRKSVTLSAVSAGEAPVFTVAIDQATATTGDTLGTDITATATLTFAGDPTIVVGDIALTWEVDGVAATGTVAAGAVVVAVGTVTHATGTIVVRSATLTVDAGPSVPATMLAPTLTGGTGSATLTFSAAPDDGGSTITGYGYQITVDGGVEIAATGTVSDRSLPVYIPLNAGSYVATVWAINAVGAGMASPASSAATVAAFAVPELVGSGDTAFWTDADNGIWYEDTAQTAPASIDGTIRRMVPEGTVAGTFMSADGFDARRRADAGTRYFDMVDGASRMQTMTAITADASAGITFFVDITVPSSLPSNEDQYVITNYDASDEGIIIRGATGLLEANIDQVGHARTQILSNVDVRGKRVLVLNTVLAGVQTLSIYSITDGASLFSGTANMTDATAAIQLDATDRIWIGSKTYTARHFTGPMHAVLILDRGLNSAEVDALMGAYGGEPVVVDPPTPPGDGGETDPPPVDPGETPNSDYLQNRTFSAASITYFVGTGTQLFDPLMWMELACRHVAVGERWFLSDSAAALDWDRNRDTRLANDPNDTVTDNLGSLFAYVDTSAPASISTTVTLTRQADDGSAVLTATLPLTMTIAYRTRARFGSSTKNGVSIIVAATGVTPNATLPAGVEWVDDGTYCSLRRITGTLPVGETAIALSDGRTVTLHVEADAYTVGTIDELYALRAETLADKTIYMLAGPRYDIWSGNRSRQWRTLAAASPECLITSGDMTDAELSSGVELTDFAPLIGRMARWRGCEQYNGGYRYKRLLVEADHRQTFVGFDNEALQFKNFKSIVDSCLATIWCPPRPTHNWCHGKLETILWAQVGDHTTLQRGTGYQVGDTLRTTGGTFVSPAEFEVRTVDGNGGITGLTTLDGGKFSYLPPRGSATTTLTGTGSGFVTVGFALVGGGDLSTRHTRRIVEFNSSGGTCLDTMFWRCMHAMGPGGANPVLEGNTYSAGAGDMLTLGNGDAGDVTYTAATHVDNNMHRTAWGIYDDRYCPRNRRRGTWHADSVQNANASGREMRLIGPRFRGNITLADAHPSVGQDVQANLWQGPTSQYAELLFKHNILVSRSVSGLAINDPTANRQWSAFDLVATNNTMANINSDTSGLRFRGSKYVYDAYLARNFARPKDFTNAVDLTQTGDVEYDFPITWGAVFDAPKGYSELVTRADVAAYFAPKTGGILDTSPVTGAVGTGLWNWATGAATIDDPSCGAPTVTESGGVITFAPTSAVDGGGTISHYDWEVYTNTSSVHVFTGGLEDRNRAARGLAAVGALETGVLAAGTYYLRCRPRNEAGPGYWSAFSASVVVS